MDSQARIGLIIPSANRLAEPQFNRYLPEDVDIHVTRLRMTGKWAKPLDQLQGAIEEAAAVLSDTSPDVIVFHCTANSMEGGLDGEQRITEWVGQASGCEAVTTSQAITEALRELAIRKLVLISPYVEATNQAEMRYMSEAGFEVVHELGLGLPGSDDYIAVTPEQWLDITCDNSRPEAEGYFLSCTNTRMIESIEAVENRLARPVVSSNQAALWACLRRMSRPTSVPGLGRLCSEG
jgi:maleate cis-trans isomerase